MVKIATTGPQLCLESGCFAAKKSGLGALQFKRAGRSPSSHQQRKSHNPSFAAVQDADPVVREAAAWALHRWIEAGVRPDDARAALA